MKKFICVFAIAVSASILPAASISMRLPFTTIPADRGAASVTELANVVFTAIQNNDFEQLPLYVPTDTELNNLKKQASEDVQAVLEDLTAETITASLRESFEAVIHEGISKTLNFNELTLADARAGNPSAKNKNLIPVTATLTTRTNQSLPLRFEVLQINGRYFLFQRMAWQAVN